MRSPSGGEGVDLGQRIAGAAWILRYPRPLSAFLERP